jgi:hypothetical protein
VRRAGQAERLAVLEHCGLAAQTAGDLVRALHQSDQPLAVQAAQVRRQRLRARATAQPGAVGLLRCANATASSGRRETTLARVGCANPAGHVGADLVARRPLAEAGRFDLLPDRNEAGAPESSLLEVELLLLLERRDQRGARAAYRDRHGDAERVDVRHQARPDRALARRIERALRPAWSEAEVAWKRVGPAARIDHPKRLRRVEGAASEVRQQLAPFLSRGQVAEHRLGPRASLRHLRQRRALEGIARHAVTRHAIARHAKDRTGGGLPPFDESWGGAAPGPRRLEPVVIDRGVAARSQQQKQTDSDEASGSHGFHLRTFRLTSPSGIVPGPR